MRRTIARILVPAAALLAVGCLHAPMPWSVDGKWLAYTVEVRPVAQLLRPGWLFRGPATPEPRRTRATVSSYRIWATQAESGTSVLLEESPSPLTAPGWSPDGRALAFGRVVAEAEGKGRFEVVVVEGSARRRVLASRPIAEIGPEAAALPGQAIAWSPDGRYLAVPQIGPNGLAILRADNGRQVNAIHDAFLPSWAPEGGRLAFFVRGTGDTLQCIDSPLAQPRLLAEVGQASQAAAWNRDGLAVVAIARRPLGKPGDSRAEEIDLIQVRLDTGTTTRIHQLGSDAAQGRDRSVAGASIAFDREGENLFASTIVEGQPCQITWFRPRENQIYKKFSILDYAAPMGSLSLSPDGRTLAARVVGLDRLSAPALCDLDSNDQKTRLIAPDDASRVEWIATLVETARSILGGLPAASTEPNAPATTRVDRPTLLPILGEFEPNSEAFHRLRKIGRMGRPLCDRPEGSPPADPEVAAILDEARLFFDYLREDYGAALASIEALEAREASPEHRRKLLTIRAQVFLNRGQLDRAARTIDYLRAIDPSPARRVEWTGSGYVATTDASGDRGWPDYLAQRSQAIRTMLHDEAAEPHPGPDAGPRVNSFQPQAPAQEFLRGDVMFPDFRTEPPRVPRPRRPGPPRPDGPQ